MARNITRNLGEGRIALIGLVAHMAGHPNISQVSER